jgi:leucyl aminopeptidase
MSDFVLLDGGPKEALSKVYILDNLNALSGISLSELESTFLKDNYSDQKAHYLMVERYSYQWYFVFIPQGANGFDLFEKMRILGDEIQENAYKKKTEHLHVEVISTHKAWICVCEGMSLGAYDYAQFRTEKAWKKNGKAKIKFSVSGNVSANDLKELNAVTEATNLCRDLVNEPVITLTATAYAERIKSLGAEKGFAVTVLEKGKIEALKMGGLLGVNKGSIDPPTFSIMEYKHPKAKNEKPLLLVGKGVVFDTGGLSLKPTANSMDSMKCDMAGSAAVVCAMGLIAEMQYPVHVIALVPATDNRPGQFAITPGDVLTMYDGTTVEVLNTDAEGRLILADALAFGKQYNPELTIELSTLTGAAAAAVGKYAIVAMGNAEERTFNTLENAGSQTMERIARFPFWDDYRELMESDIADIKNIGGPEGGAITAGKFLEHFAPTPYIHLDIAGPSWLKKKDKYRAKNGSGVGVRLLHQFIKNQYGLE